MVKSFPMSTTGIIGGTSLMESTVFNSWKKETVDTPYGTVEIKRKEAVSFLQRHGVPPVPPHKINHKANIQAMKNLGVTHIIAINSVGSLKISLKPGTFIIPDDFISPWQIITFFDNEMKFTVPQTDDQLNSTFFQFCKQFGLNVSSGGTYIQTIGPRLETKAEIGMLKLFGDVIGMTMASEATLSMESGIAYTSLCSIDNYCNGIASTPLTMDEINENLSKNLKSIETVLNSLSTGCMKWLPY